MPNPEQERIDRINKLLKEFKNKNVTKIDSIIQRASELYPYLKEYTIKSYAIAVLKILKARKKEEKGEEKKEEKEANHARNK
jgi:uncharacterized protein YutD